MAATPPINRAWVQARVDEYGQIEKACPQGVSRMLWRDICKKLGVSARHKDASLEAALRALADSAES